MAGGKNILVTDFYCTKCGAKGMPLARKKSKLREAGHMKKIYCIHCKEEVNHIEIRPFDYDCLSVMEDLKAGKLYKPEVSKDEENY